MVVLVVLQRQRGKFHRTQEDGSLRRLRRGGGAFARAGTLRNKEGNMFRMWVE